jgi:hypothetical protein
MDVGELTEDAVNGLFHALADPTRRDIIRRCAADEPRFLGKPHESGHVDDLRWAKALGITRSRPPSGSRHRTRIRDFRLKALAD